MLTNNKRQNATRESEMPQLEPLNMESSSSMSIPPPPTHETEKKDEDPHKALRNKIKKELDQFPSCWHGHWNPLNLREAERELPTEAVGVDIQCCRGGEKCGTWDSMVLGWYLFLCHFRRDTSKLFCLLAIMGLPWNQPEEDIPPSIIIFFYVVMFTLAFSFFSMPSDSRIKSGTTFFRVVLLTEKYRESKSTKRIAFCAHLFLLFTYSVYYAWAYIQSSCIREHKTSESQFIYYSDKLYRVNYCQYRFPFPSTPFVYNSSTRGWDGFGMIGLNSDALLPDSLSFYMVLLAYSLAMFDIFSYDDVYNRTMLPRAEFIRTHYPDQFEIARQAAIKKR